MILQKSELPNMRTVQIKKNRYDGDVGNQHMAFNPENKRYFEVTPFEHQVFEERGGKIEGLIQHRLKKYDGELEPHLAELALKNPRVKLQTPKNKIEDIMMEDFETIEKMPHF